MTNSIRIGVVVFPGSNCDQDMIDALSVYPQVELVKLWHKSSDLQDVQLVVLPGGFSFGDYLRSGAIARFSPIMNEVIRFAASGGYVFGVCNGFQILCESHLLPGALLHNNSHNFICKNVYLKPGSTQNAMTKRLAPADVFEIPIAHGEGRFYTDADSLKRIQDNDQVLFRYCSKDGSFGDEFNPNGAIDHIAGICNEGKNVFGMMPHPERAASPILGNTDGRILITGFMQELFGEVFEPNYSVSM
jgi:phosphoribosylformylglycinamidine synthase subunit PurQ / glutaminase